MGDAVSVKCLLVDCVFIINSPAYHPSYMYSIPFFFCLTAWWCCLIAHVNKVLFFVSVALHKYDWCLGSLRCGSWAHGWVVCGACHVAGLILCWV